MKLSTKQDCPLYYSLPYKKVTVLQRQEQYVVVDTEKNKRLFKTTQHYEAILKLDANDET